MTDRRRRCPLGLEPLEPRVYLSLGSSSDLVDPAVPAVELRPPVDQSASADISPTVEVQPVDRADSPADLIVVDVNGIENTSDALLAAFDNDTGKLLDAVRLTEGRLVLVPSSTVLSGNLHVSPAPLGFDGSVDSVDRGRSASVAIIDQTLTHLTLQFPLRLLNAVVGNEPSSANRSDSLTAADSFGTQHAVVANGDGPSVPNPRASAVAASPPVVVIFPTGNIPATFRVEEALQEAARPDPGSARDPAKPLIVSRALPQWLTVLAPSPWWSRAVGLPGVQSRVGELSRRDLEDESFGGRSRLLPRSNSPSGRLDDVEWVSSRVVLRSPVRLMLFTTPLAHSAATARPATELAVYNFATGQLTRTGHLVSGRLVAADGHVAFLSPELGPGEDLDDDGVIGGLVLRVFDPVTGGVRNTRISAESIRAEAGRLIVGIRDSGPGDSSAQPAAASGMLWAYRFDPAAGRLAKLPRSYDAPADEVPAAPASALDRVDHPIAADGRLSIIQTGGKSDTSEPFVLPAAAPLDSPVYRSNQTPMNRPSRPSAGEAAGPPRPGGTSASESPAGSGSDGAGGGD